MYERLFETLSNITSQKEKKKEKITIAFARLYNTQMHIMLGSQTHRGKTAIRKKK